MTFPTDYEVYMYEGDLQLGKLKENCLLLKLFYSKNPKP